MNNQIFSGLFWRFGERILAQLVTFIVSVILARILDPKDYGNVALIIVFITIANVFVVNGFGSALIQKLNVDNIDFSSVFYANIGLSLFIYLILYLLSPVIADFYSSPILCSALRVLALRIPIAAINSIQQAYVSRNMLFKKFFFSTLFGTLLSGVVGCVMAYMGFGIWALVAQYLTNTFVDTVVLWFTVKWRPNFVFSWERVKLLLSYGWKLLLSGLLDTGYNQLRSLIIGRIYSSEDLAFYNRGQQYPLLIVTNINTSISSVLFPAISKSQNDLVAVKNMTRRAIKVSSYIMWPLMIGLAVIAKPLISLMLTDKWLPCVPYLQIACFTYAFWPIHTANLEAIKALGRSEIFLFLEVIKKGVGIGLLLVTMNHGVMAIALSLIVSTITSSFINAYPNRKLLKYGYIDQIRDIMPSFLISSFMGIVIYLLCFIIKNSLLLIISQITLGCLIYIISSKLLCLESFNYILNILLKRKKG